MACKTCSSENQQNFSVELTVAFPDVERVNLAPVYVCQKTLVCLDCGYTEFVFPAIALSRLRKGNVESHSNFQFVAEYSRLQ